MRRWRWAGIRNLAFRVRERGRRQTAHPGPEVVPRTNERLDADRVVVDVQREVPTRMALALRGVRLARAHPECLDRGRARRVLLRTALHRSILPAAGRGGAPGSRSSRAADAVKCVTGSA